MTVEIRDPRFRDVVGDGVEIETLGTGYLFTEGPLWHAAEKHLTFSDMPGDHMRRWTPEGGVVTFRQPSNKANGNAHDMQGRMVTCEHATSRVTRTEADGTITVLASHYQGRELNSPNDVVVKGDGAIYFTDPVFGRREFFGLPREQDLDFQGVYRIAPGDGSLSLLADDFEQPNGLCFSLDESLLFINDTPRKHIRVFDVQPDGHLANGRLWAEVSGEGEGLPDGLKCDSQGNIYCTGPGGIHVFDNEAKCLGVILMPEKTANFTWGDNDLKTLFATSSTSLYRLRVKVPGR
jgi:gluconolactonase